MTERQRNYWLRACTEAKAFVTLNESKLKDFKGLESSFNYIKTAKVNDLATYLRHHPNGDVCKIVTAASMSAAGKDDEFIFNQISNLSSVIEEHAKVEAEAVEAKGIGEESDNGGETPND